MCFCLFFYGYKKPTKNKPWAYFRGGAYYRDDICVKNQGGLFSGGGAYYRDFTVLENTTKFWYIVFAPEYFLMRVPRKPLPLILE